MVFSGFRTRILRLISHLSSIMSHNSTEVVNLLSPGGVSGSDRVVVWASHVTSPDVLSMARTYRVVSVTRLKEKNTALQHELLELKVTDGSPNSVTLWLVVERGGGIPRTRSPSSTPNSSTMSVDASAHASDQSSSQLLAKDNVRVRSTSLVGGLRSMHNVVARLDLPPNSANPLTVCDMAALLSVVPPLHPYYDVRSYNCYWFAATIIHSIKDVYGGSLAVTSGVPSGGNLGIIPVITLEDIRKDVEKAIPAWDVEKAACRAKKTTQEVSLNLFILSWSSINDDFS